MLSCRVCKRITIDSSNSICPTCNWNFQAKQNSEEEKWAQIQWNKNQENENELEKFKRDYQKLREEKEKINSKFENLYRQLVEKAEERERLLLNILQPISSIPSKLDEIVDAIKIPLETLLVQYTPPNQIKKGTSSYIDKRKEIYSQNITVKPKVAEEYSEVNHESHITSQPLLINPEEAEVVKLYNGKHKKFLECIIKVSLTQDSLEKDRLGRTIQLFFQKNNKGTYWIFIDKQKYFLFPEHHFKLNEFNYQALETSFICYGNWRNEGSELKVLKPAIVRPLDQGGEKWEFVDRGVIEFTSI